MKRFWNAALFGSALTLFANGAIAQSVTASGVTINSIPKVSSTSSNAVTLTNSLITESGGNVGIGTTSPPSQALTVNGNIQSLLGTLPGANPGFNVAGIISLGQSVGSMGNTGAENWSLRGVYQYPSGVNYNSAGGDLDLIKSLDGNTILGTKTDGTALGNVGIGTTKPAAKVDVGGGSSNYVLIEGTNTTTVGSVIGYFQQDVNGGRGTWGVNAEANTTYSSAITRLNTSFGSWAWLGQVQNSTYTSQDSMSLQYVTATGTQAERMRVDSNGNVGIGTPSPVYKLDVAGQIHTAAGVVYPDGSTQSVAWTGSLCGGDYAESIDLSDDRKAYEPGDVLVIDPKIKGKFLKSSKPYSPMVAGVFSTKPGVVGRRQTSEKSPEEIPMAVVGIVPVKVSAENGPIEPGDMLVTSSSPGIAMKGTDRSLMFGAVIGKAMSSLDSGSGMIEVLVSLQ